MMYVAADRATGEGVLERLDEARSNDEIGLADLALVYKNDKGKVKVQQTSDVGFGRGAVRGGAVGLIIGILAAPVGTATAVGAAAGGVVAKLRDSGIDNKAMKAYGALLEDGHSLVCALGEESAISQLVDGADATPDSEYLVIPAEAQDALAELAKLPADLGS